MGGASFSWMPIYRELAVRLLEWRKKQPELIEILNAAEAKGYLVGSLKDEDKKGQKFLLNVMDPFTFFATFNRKVGEESRLGILEVVKERFGLVSPLPSDFDGLPVMNPQKAQFFSWERDREKHAIDTLWDFAEAVVRKIPKDVQPELFARCLEIRQVGIANLTMGMFWMRPDAYVALDSRNRAYLKAKDIDPDVDNWKSYLALREEIGVRMPGVTWPELSLKAYEASNKRYWLFQAHEKLFDLVGALREDSLRVWQVRQHKNDIHVGDRVAVCLAGRGAGIYAMATVETAPAALPEDSPQSKFWKGGDQEKFDRVKLCIDRNLWDRPLLREDVQSSRALKDLPMGRQGTIFSLTQEQFDAVASATAHREPHYWIYAPGRQAMYWDEFFRAGIMGLGWDEVGNLSSCADRESIQRKLKKIYPGKSSYIYDSLALWEFSKVMQPGDIVIAKKGRSQYVGYGIVAGSYTYDAQRSNYRNIRRVIWKKQGEWSSGGYKIVTKTLTDISKYPDYVKDLRALIGIEEEPPMPPPNQPILPSKNIILYGPPGTGKTYKLRNHYMELFTDRTAALTTEERAAELVRNLSWWEVVAVALLDAKDQRSTVTQILEHPLVDARWRQSANRTPRAMVWAALQTHTKADCPNVKYASRIEPLIFWKDDTSTWSIDVKLASTEMPALQNKLNAYRNPTTEGDTLAHRYKFTTFHQSFSYEDFIEGIKPQMDSQDGDQLAYEIRDGVFKELVREAKINPSKSYALFIDEINRGNVASIFGELITLIEDDKRLGTINELMAVLPYSREEFSIPQNLYIIGTMNTADRSVEALDTALRRRFTFMEMRPDRSLVPEPAGMAVDLKRLFDVINARIEQLLDHDHCIGHAYFMGMKDINDLRLVFANKIIPLLREYFYGNPAKVGMVLGERFVTRKTGKTAFASGAWGADELDEKEVYAFADVTKLKEEDFASIYAEANSSI
jgi:Cdc6-like AAA superfamily ATPase